MRERGLFEFPVEISDLEAPANDVWSFENLSYFGALLTNDRHEITASEFLKYGQRFATLCDRVYQGSAVTLGASRGIPRPDLIASHQSPFAAESSVITLDQTRINEHEFNEIFDSVYFMGLKIQPKQVRNGFLPPHSTMIWTAERSKELAFVAQDFDTYNNGEIDGLPLKSLLKRKMFHAGDGPPRGTKTKLGDPSTIRNETKMAPSLPKHMPKGFLKHVIGV